jgi:hypothetical protein
LIRKVFHEPLVHFLALGAALFMLFGLAGGRSEPESQKVFVTSGKIDQMITIYSRTWQRPPNAEELEGLIEDEIREQVLYREAMAMGLDKDDTIVRRRLRQKFEFLMEDIEAVSVPTDRDLQDWIDKHPGKFSTEPKFSFLQVYLSVSRRGEDASVEATNLLARLNNTDEKVNASDLGDATLLPFEFPLSSTDVIAQVFGSQFAQQLQGLEPGRWSGPLRSSYGLNLVYVRERTDAKLRSLGEVRDEARREWIRARQKELAGTVYLNLRKKYSIVLETQPVRAGGPVQSSGPQRGAEGQ